MSGSADKPNGIREIAEALGVSIGTVDRALHGRPGISPQTRDSVLRMAKKLNYKPNFAARNLKLSRTLRFGIFLPERIAVYFDSMQAGMQAAAERLTTGTPLELKFFRFPRLGDGDVECMERARWHQFDGVVLAPGNPSGLSTLFRDSSAPPLLFIGSDAPLLDRIASVSSDATVSGRIAADLLGRVLPQPAKVAMIAGDLRIQDHGEKLRGFSESLAVHAPQLTLLPPLESHDNPEEGYEAARKLLRRHPALGGLYLGTANSLPVLRAVDEAKLLGRLKIVTTDLFPELVPLIESDRILCSLHQRPFTQGKMAVEMLYAHVLGLKPVPPITRLAPHLVLRSNLSLFADGLDQEASLLPDS
ncbi:LacI family DNA-binding transcriptional regulator [Terriglobus tenax]|uniref:LacI family DNA-binding transcriptional regulator n=1 Tax=Terriglobus tenax TaxID=1111115 RepID=UPI0021E0D086|nr:LacI family DNA-binding transcriptional regulator [Terriglobus tenax]